jgi:broad specificity phosphatase PhoE
VTTILIARHGESDWNREKRWQGHADRPLTGRGHEQARELAERLAHVELEGIYSSDLRRARETAEAVAERRGGEVRIEPALREVDVGSWSGLTREEAEERFPDGFRRWCSGRPGWEDGETYEAMAGRVLATIERIGTEHEAGLVLVVSHGGPIRAIHAAALGLDIHAYRRLRPVEPNARLSAVRRVDGRLADVYPASEIDDLIARERREAGEQVPRSAG